MELRVYETVSQKPNGDRDTRTHPSSSFEVVLVNGDLRSVMFSNDQFDKWWCHINGTRKEYLDEALKKADEIAKTLGGIKVIHPDRTAHEKKVIDVKARIRASQDELKKLLKEGGCG